MRTHQLAQSPIALATYLRELFADASGTWRDDHIEATVPDGRSTAAAKIAAAKRAQHAEQTQATTNVYRITSTLAARSRHALVQSVLGIAVFVLVLVAAIVVGRSIAGGEHAGNAHARARAVDHAEHERAEVPPRRPRSSAHRRSTRFVRDER